MAQNVKKVASKNLKKPKVAENSKSCQNSKKLPKISKVAEKLPSNLWLSLHQPATVEGCLPMREALAWIEFREFITEGEQFPLTEILYVTLGIIDLK